MQLQPDHDFDRAVQIGHRWVREVACELGDRHDRQAGYAALRAVLHAVRDGLSPAAAAALGAHLPMLLRGLYYEGYRPAGKPARARSADELLDRVLVETRRDDIDPVEALRAVFVVLRGHLAARELDDVVATLPSAARPIVTSRRAHEVWEVW